jgi:MFS family permease
VSKASFSLARALMSPPEKEGRILGLTQSVGSIARIPGPVLSGVATELIGLSSSFLFGGLILIIPFLLGCRVFRVCTVEGLLDLFEQ